MNALCDCFLFGLFICFNPRTYKRCDKAQTTQVNLELVSIHAPTRGATPTNKHIMETNKSFNPRTYKRCDYFCFFHKVNNKCFNPRTYKRCDGFLLMYFFASSTVSIHAPTRGATRMQALHHHFLVGFNPRTYKRCDS